MKRKNIGHMKSLIFILVTFACNSGAGNNLPDADSSLLQNDSTNGNDSAGVDTTTLGGGWYLVPVLPSDTVTGKLAYLNFNTATNRVTGNTGCNSMSGTFTRTDSGLAFNEDIILTKMACPGYNEQAFIESLLQTNDYRFERGELVLMFNETDLSRWSRKPVKSAEVNKI